MAGKKLDYTIGVDSSKGVTGVKNFSRTVQQELKKIEDEFDDTATAGQKVATVLSAMAKELDTELDRAAQAADALSTALGPELAGKADVGQLVGDLQRMGLTFEEIVTDADKLATSLKELDQVQVKGLDSGLGGVDTKLGNLGESARSSGSVMANMVGNATQDLGALGGVAGSAGVAIGQMGEYMTEALSSGEKLGSVMANFGKVAGPMAAIALGVQLLSGFMERAKKNQQELAEATREVVDALLEAQDAGTGAIESLEGLGDEKVVEVLEKLGATDFDEFDAATRRLGLDYADLVAGFQSGDGALNDTLDTYDQLVKRWEELVILTGSNSKAWAALADETGRDRTELQRWMADAGAVDRAMGDQLDTQGKALDQGDRIVQMRQEYSDAEREAAAATEEGARAAEEGEAAIAAYRDAVEQSKQVVLDYADAIKEAALNVAKTEGEMRDLAGVFVQMGVRGDALRRIFDLRNAPIDAEAAVRDIALAIDDLSVAAEGIDLSEGLDPSNVNADALLDAIDALRPEIQAKIADAFSAGGPEAARAMAADYVAQVAEQLGISEIEAAELLGLENVEALIHVAIEQASLDNAKSQLAILTGLTGETPLTASIALALETGEITPEQAQILAQDQLGDLGVDIPADLKVKTTKRELREAYKAVGIDPDKPIGQPLKVEPTGLRAAADAITAGPKGGWPAIEVPIKPVLSNYVYPAALVPGGSGLAAPAPAGRGLLAAAPAAAAGPSMAPITVPVAAARPTVVNNYTVHSSVNAAVVGSTFDVMRAVDEANRRAARLLPRNL